ncbi:PTS sugar transporter subunit IIB [Vibrio panuliri]|uniref:PTS ascorbate transporter subunit IIB n=2 Tax=Vibrio panuliri TaxID=1381081 RepID=A0A1Q9HER5_9VIBR|nr:PTS sugar transporter subunit IIB [Vibrio panuliri]KAB1454635.1 PTS sugar transporter subunit IIB [Vibrio panuliri]OLQ88209.1 PTS ascorbate transporter subunit IIB [Vibrio panuliri]OLQ94992.1 PTS ascorbate transporter subunit IIB [Vibrio panuliri]
MKGLVVCRTGMGSSMMLKIKVEQVINENSWNAEVKHDVYSGLDSHRDVDFVVTMSDLMTDVEKAGYRAVGIQNLMDKNEIREKLLPIFEG